MVKHSDYCTHISNPEDVDVLTRPLFDVNMRLFATSAEYKAIVLQVCDYIKWCCETEKEGYKKPHGWSGANAGIPFNIIAVMRNGEAVVMINPKILNNMGRVIPVMSNCGSLTLPESIRVDRHKYINLAYYDTSGQFCYEAAVDRAEMGFTIQHEVDHNLGTLITDRWM